MIQYLVSNSIPERMEFIKKSKPFGKRIAIYNQIPMRGIEMYFDKWYKLTDLYKDEIFLKLLAKIDNKTSIFLIDLGLDYCSYQANYIKPYTKLSAIFGQAKDTFIIDGFAFYNTEKAIYRPFLYINGDIIGSSVQEFYNSKGFESFEDNKIENYYHKIKPFIKISTKPIEIEVVKYTPTELELFEYEKLKKEVIIEKQYPKVKVIRLLQDYVNNSFSKNKAVKKNEEFVLNVTENSNSSRVEMYKNILLTNPKKIIFYSSGIYGADEIELSRTRDALIRHNKLIELING
jgi:hypothetical protein